jgi:hypothetical protein
VFVDLLRENNNKLSEIISEFNLTNVINEPKRNGALLDPILVSNLDIHKYQYFLALLW